MRKYQPSDQQILFDLIEREGLEWQDYYNETGRVEYQKALSTSTTYLAFEDDYLCAYLRCRDDDGFGIYIYDILVDSAFRGKEYGRLLMEQVWRDFPENTVYVLGDVYPYYEKVLNYEVAGKIYIVKPKEPKF